MTNLFFTSDLHFGHTNIIPWRDSRWPDVSEMNEYLVERWNDIVEPGDHTVVVGDIVMGKRDENLPIIHRLNGTKSLVSGNHDHCSRYLWGRGEKGDAKHKRWLETYGQYFDDVIEGTLMFGPFDVNHFPYGPVDHTNEPRHIDQRPVDNGRPLLHGHTHSPHAITMSDKGTTMINVGVDAWSWQPVPYEALLNLVDATER